MFCPYNRLTSTQHFRNGQTMMWIKQRRRARFHWPSVLPCRASSAPDARLAEAILPGRDRRFEITTRGNLAGDSVLLDSDHSARLDYLSVASHGEILTQDEAYCMLAARGRRQPFAAPTTDQQSCETSRTYAGRAATFPSRPIVIARQPRRHLTGLCIVLILGFSSRRLARG